MCSKPERLHQHILQCNDWPISNKANYLYKVAKESSSSYKHICDNENTSAEQLFKKMTAYSSYICLILIKNLLLNDNFRNSIYGFIAFKQHQNKNPHLKYSKIENTAIKNIIFNKYHFVTNNVLAKVLKPVVDAIGRLESSDFMLTDVFKELVNIHQQISQSEVPIDNFKTLALAIINQCAKEFDFNIYFVALFLSSTSKQLAISKKIDGNKIIRTSLKITKVWDFSKKDTGLLYKELINYKNNDPSFDILPLSSSQSLRSFWADFTKNTPFLCYFAMKILAIVSYSASFEQLFSMLSLVKSKIRNQLLPNNLSIIDQLKNKFKKDASKVN
ncbi:18000_t:CDS:2 [Cetraspora pellucida]|uniref:18000_t:CDS:1 n=1 Tax=Cetraspora pellucida TaxID=1433469 RepID=A0ACA9KTY7_9GLOM|nr:18000_t:CDS:2 [Cetraspora pellucida]